MANVGTEFKVNIGMQPIGETHLSGCDFNVVFYTNGLKEHTVEKAEMIKVDDDNYLALVDSKKTGSGELRARVFVYLPDADFEDGFRTEVVDLSTGIVISK